MGKEVEWLQKFRGIINDDLIRKLQGGRWGIIRKSPRQSVTDQGICFRESAVRAGPKADLTDKRYRRHGTKCT